MKKFNFTLFLIFSIVFLLIFMAVKIVMESSNSKRSNFTVTEEPNYHLKPAGSYPPDRFMRDPAKKMDAPYYEGPYGDMILPDYLGMYDENPDYQDYTGIYPT